MDPKRCHVRRSGIEIDKPELVRILADNLIQQRRKKGGSQASVAASLGLSRTTLTDIESGLRNPSFSLVALLANYYEVRMDDLIKDSHHQRLICHERGSSVRGKIGRDLVSVSEILSHRRGFRYREFSLFEGQRVRLKGRSRKSKELLICHRGQIAVQNKFRSEFVRAGEYLDLVSQNEVFILALQNDTLASLVEARESIDPASI